MLTINIAGPADVPALLDTLRALTAQLSGTAAAVADPAVSEAPRRRGRPPKTTEPTATTSVDAADESQDPADQQPKAEPQPEPQAAAPSFTADSVMAALTAYARSKGPAALAAVLAKVGAKRASEIPAGKYPELMKEIGGNG